MNKKFTFLLVLVSIFIIPQIIFAAWWNPLDWFSFVKTVFYLPRVMESSSLSLVSTSTITEQAKISTNTKAIVNLTKAKQINTEIPQQQITALKPVVIEQTMSKVLVQQGVTSTSASTKEDQALDLIKQQNELLKQQLQAQQQTIQNINQPLSLSPAVNPNPNPIPTPTPSSSTIPTQPPVTTTYPVTISGYLANQACVSKGDNGTFNNITGQVATINLSGTIKPLDLVSTNSISITVNSPQQLNSLDFDEDGGYEFTFFVTGSGSHTVTQHGTGGSINGMPIKIFGHWGGQEIPVTLDLTINSIKFADGSQVGGLPITISNIQITKCSWSS